MDKKKISPFQFRKISKESLEKNQTSKGKKYKPGTNLNNTVQPLSLKPKNDNDLLRKIGDKDKLSTMEEKFQVLDYIFKRNYNTVRICYGCGQQTGSKFYVSYTRGKILFVCPGCFQALQPCSNCGLPSPATSVKLPSQYCSYCKPTKQCSCCGSTIKAKDSHRIPHVKGLYCNNCYHDSEKCVVCNIPIIEKTGIEVAGANICPDCHDRKISSEDLSELNRSVIDFLAKELDLKETLLLYVGLASYKVVNSQNPDSSLNAYITISGKEILALYQGISNERAAGVLAYEYGKLILKQINPVIQNPDVVHAFSLWVKSFVLKSFGELDEVMQIKDLQGDNPNLKTLMNIERLGGIPRIIERIKEGVIGRK